MDRSGLKFQSLTSISLPQSTTKPWNPDKSLHSSSSVAPHHIYGHQFSGKNHQLQHPGKNELTDREFLDHGKIYMGVNEPMISAASEDKKYREIEEEECFSTSHLKKDEKYREVEEEECFATLHLKKDVSKDQILAMSHGLYGYGGYPQQETYELGAHKDGHRFGKVIGWVTSSQGNSSEKDSDPEWENCADADLISLTEEASSNHSNIIQR